MPHQDRLNIAVFIDFDNIEIGVKTTLGQQFDVGIILDAIKERGEVVTKIAYADWTRSGEYSRSLTQHAIRLVQRNMTPGGDKNGADINLALDALEMAFTHPHINAYVIVGGDSDFLSLVEKLKQYDKKVFVVGGRAFTSMILQRNCHEFIAYENLAGVRKNAAKIGRPMPAAARELAGRAGRADRAPRAEDPRRPRGLAADRVAQEHAAAARLDLLRAQLRRLVVPRLRREAVAGGHRQPQARRPQRDGGAERGRVGRGRGGRRSPARAGGVARPRRRPTSSQMFRAAEDQAARDDDDDQGRRPAARYDAAGAGAAAGGDPGAIESAAGRRPARRSDSLGGDDGALADVPAQRQTDPASGRWRLRRTALRLRRPDGPAEGMPARGVRPDRARSPRRAARVPGSGDAEGGNAAERARDRRRRGDRDAPGEAIETMEPVETEQPEMEPIPIDTTAELLGRAKQRKPRARAPRQPAATPTPRKSTRAAQGATTRAKARRRPPPRASRREARRLPRSRTSRATSRCW